MKLTLVGLPLGNINDISLRAIEKLKQALVVICEDTRVFHRLWQKLMNLGYLPSAFDGKLIVLNDFNEKYMADKIAEEIKDYEEVILVSDAGMPIFSDPGFRLVRRMIEVGQEIDVIPGPTAATTSLALSGLSSDRVLFLGFLPKKQGKRSQVFEYIKNLSLETTVIFYEAPARIEKTLREMLEALGERDASLVRELTKEHQEVIRGNLQEILTIVKNKKIKGELVLLLRAGGKVVNP
ncbi:16S rRNA (cytidine(1402)-2'-O)-methyltransferase [Candidatus Collierbacteria bacterium]|nr:16S rRNA (cytidine(1402)-2'-O)-methyltransferase [Candidatus Collierbacteria bacterium]